MADRVKPFEDKFLSGDVMQIDPNQPPPGLGPAKQIRNIFKAAGAGVPLFQAPKPNMTIGRVLGKGAKIAADSFLKPQGLGWILSGSTPIPRPAEWDAEHPDYHGALVGMARGLGKRCVKR